MKRGPVHTVRASGRIDYMGGSKRYKGKAFLLSDETGRLRFEVISPPPMNSTVLMVTSDGTSVRVWNARTKEFFEGPSSVCMIRAFLSIPVGPKELFALLTASVPHTSGATLAWDSDCGCEKVTVFHGNVKWVYLIDGRKGPSGWHLSGVRVHLPDGVLKVDYRGFFRAGTHVLAKRARIRYKKNDIVFSWSAMDTEAELPDDAFDQDIPPSAKVVKLACDDNGLHEVSRCIGGQCSNSSEDEKVSGPVKQEAQSH